MSGVHFDFTGSVVLVTGGGTGIGQAISDGFLDAGATVVVTGRRRERLEAAVAGRPEGQAMVLPADVSDSRQVTWSIGPTCGSNSGRNTAIPAISAGSFLQR